MTDEICIMYLLSNFSKVSRELSAFYSGGNFMENFLQGCIFEVPWHHWKADVRVGKIILMQHIAGSLPTSFYLILEPHFDII